MKGEGTDVSHICLSTNVNHPDNIQTSSAIRGPKNRFQTDSSRDEVTMPTFPLNRVLAHRGLWTTPHDQNSENSLSTALGRGYGIEFDIRDHEGEIVVSHHSPAASSLRFTALINDYLNRSGGAFAAINVKSDGLPGLMSESLTKALKNNGLRHFFFDMSFPDSRLYLQRGLPVALRISEFESPKDFSGYHYVWVDVFVSDWWSDIYEDLGFPIGITPVFVSSELHGRDPNAMWKKLREFHKKGRLFLVCTDYPDDFVAFMGKGAERD